MFHFVNVSHPDEIKDRKNQGRLRQHAIRQGIQRGKAHQAKKSGIFVAVKFGEDAAKPIRPRPTPAPLPAMTLTKAPSVTLMDPFDTLAGCPEHMHRLIQHDSGNHASKSVTSVNTLAERSRESMGVMLHGAKKDPVLFHALSLTLPLATNNRLPKIEVLSHRGHLLSDIRGHITDQNDTPIVSMLVAMLLLIGYEYRIDGTNSESIATHMCGIQSVMKLCEERNVNLVNEVQRALFWQDLFSCLMSGTSRLLSHNNYQDYRLDRDVEWIEHKRVPHGFSLYTNVWPEDALDVVRDLSNLCSFVDTNCNSVTTPLAVFPIDNVQANLNSRIVNRIQLNRILPKDSHLMCEASMYAAYLCTFNLWIGVWAGCYIPEVCVNQIFRCVSEFVQDPKWNSSQELVLWLLFVSGGSTSRREARHSIGRLIHRLFQHHFQDMLKTWESTRGYTAPIHLVRVRHGAEHVPILASDNSSSRPPSSAMLAKWHH